MSIPNSAEAHRRVPTQPLADKLPSWLRAWRGLILLGAIVFGLGLAFNWSWLVAAGVVPLLLSVLPCVAMCALGLCVNRMAVPRNDASSTIPSEDKAAAGLLETPRSCCPSGQSAPTATLRR